MISVYDCSNKEDSTQGKFEKEQSLEFGDENNEEIIARIKAILNEFLRQSKNLLIMDAQLCE